jgi:nucleotide-binding universal stress UspA family protein
MDPGRIGPVVVGVDGSPNSRRALVLAGRHARSTGARLTVVHAIGLTEEIDGTHVPAFGHHDEIAARVDSWCDSLREDGRGDFDTRLVDGPPVDALLRTADDVGASVIVVGRRGAGGLPELLLGSTAHQVVERSHCPVLVIPPIGRSAAVAPPPA